MTADPKLHVRFAVGKPNGRRSAIWTVFSTRDEVYAAHRTQAGIEKISFHSSRICRRAFVKIHQLPASMADRVFDRWYRAETAPVGEGRAVAVLTIYFPECHLSADLPTTTKNVSWLPTPDEGGVRGVQICFTRESDDEVRRLICPHEQQLVAHHQLPNGERVFIRSWASTWEQPDLILPASHGATKDIACPAAHVPGPSRSVSLTLYKRPEELQCFELTGFYLPAGEALRTYPGAHRFDRNEVTERRGSF